jgi:hypothetical protein
MAVAKARVASELLKPEATSARDLAADAAVTALLDHLAEELARISRKRLDVTPLAFRKNSVERERGLARTGQASDDHQLVAWDFDGDVFQVVDACAHDSYGIGRHIKPLGVQRL